MYNIENLLEASVYHQRRIDFTSEYVARQQGYTGFINEDIAVAPKPPSRLFGNHSTKICDDRLCEKRKLERDGKGQGDIDWVNRSTGAGLILILELMIFMTTEKIMVGHNTYSYSRRMMPIRKILFG